MNADLLRALQAPVKSRYREDPKSASATLRATGTLDPERLVCKVGTFAGPVEAGLHPMAGGPGSQGCSGEMLLEALAACAGVTLAAVATALAVSLRGGRVTAEGDLDFRGTLGVSRDVPIGFGAIRLIIELDTDAPREQVDKLIALTERHCAILQTLKTPPSIATVLTR
jgi:uncharacterized OsmC-like protein